MRGNIPLRPTGDTAEAFFAIAVWEKLFGVAGRYNNTTTVKVSETSKGVSWHAVAPGGGSGSDIEGPFAIQSVQADYLTVLDYNPATDTNGTTPIYIAKEWKHQNSLQGETIFGVNHVYIYQDGTNPPNGLHPADGNNVFRIDTYAGNTEVQRIVPPWVCGAAGEIVFAFAADLNMKAADNTPITLMVCGRSCQWGVVNS